MPAILETENLSRRFGSFQAVTNLNLRVEEGDIYGFLGLNGAGKTTTLRMCMKLIRPSGGSVHIFGEDIRTGFISIMKRVGALVELPAYYPHLSARKNLEILRLATGGLPTSRIDEVLDMVGLGERKEGAVGKYSQGMRQRLGIAMALLPHPRLVVLDEPTNGLDPHGINQIRGLIQDLNRKGVTFIISSHLLHEVEITCNRVGIIRKGELLEQESVKTILARTGNTVRIEAAPIEKAFEVARGLPYVSAIADSGDGRTFTAKMDAEKRPEFNAELVKAGVAVSGFSPEKLSLEEYFLSK